MRNDPDLGEVVRGLEEKCWDQVVKIPGERRPLRIADFAQEDGELKMYLDNGSSVFVVPKAYRYEVFYEAHSGIFAGHFSAHKIFTRLRRGPTGQEWLRISISGLRNARSVSYTTTDSHRSATETDSDVQAV